MAAMIQANVISRVRGEAAWDSRATSPVIHIIDDNSAVHDRASSLFESKGWTVREYFSAEEFLAGKRPTGDHCLIVDIMLPGMSGINLLQMLSVDGLPAPAVVLSDRNDASIAVAAMKAGATDFLHKPADWNKLFTSVTDAVESYRVARAREEERKKAKERFGKLTKRERDVLMMILEGKPNKIIASDLDINIRTVENHRANVMKKTGATSLPALVKHFLTSVESKSQIPF